MTDPWIHPDFFAASAKGYWEEPHSYPEGAFVRDAKAMLETRSYSPKGLCLAMLMKSGTLARHLLDYGWEHVGKTCQELAACVFAGHSFLGGPIGPGEIRAEVDRARELFPNPDGLFAALMEEIGELAEELQKGPGVQIAMRRKKAIQTIAMCVRLAYDGDPTLTKVRQDRWARNLQTGEKLENE